MPTDKTNHEVMSRSFATIKAEATLKEAYQALQQNLAGPPHAPGLVVVDTAGKYAGVLTVDDFMQELGRLYRAACDKPGKGEWFQAFFNQCEIMGFKQVAEIMSSKRLSLKAGDSFEKSCEMLLAKQVSLLVMVDDQSHPVGIITRRQVLEEIAPRMFP
jgi:predicted transcriptional regulator